MYTGDTLYSSSASPTNSGIPGCIEVCDCFLPECIEVFSRQGLKHFIPAGCNTAQYIYINCITIHEFMPSGRHAKHCSLLNPNHYHLTAQPPVSQA
ncbi:hypothetical protein FKM82_009025 [Ascaphus truei]